MDTSIVTALIGGVSGLVAGAIASLVAPWVHWGIEKRRDQREARRELLRSAQRYVSSRQFGVSQFARQPEYARLKPFLSQGHVRAIENDEEVRDQMDDPGEFRESLRAEVLDDLQHLERQWNLI